MARPISGKKPKNFWFTLKTLLSYMGRHKFLFLAVAVLVTLSALGNLLGTYMIRPVVNSVGAGDINALARGVILTAVIFAIGALAAFGYTQTMVYAAQKVLYDIRRDLFAHIQSLPLRFFDTQLHGDIMSYFTNDVDTVSDALNNSFAMTIQSFIQIVGTLTLLFILNWRLSLIVVVGYAAMFLYIRFSAGRSTSYYTAQQAALGDVNGYIEEMVSGQKVVKVFNHEPENLRVFGEKNEVLRKAGTGAQSYAATMVPAVVSISYINYAIVAVVGGLMVLNGMTDIGSLSSYLVFVRQAALPINQFTQQSHGRRRADFRGHGPGPRGGRGQGPAGERAPGKRRPHRLPGKDRPLGLAEAGRGTGSPAGGRAVPRCKLWLRQGPHHPPRRQPVRKAGPEDRLCGLVGSTGAGKTTITNLINRFYDIDSGSVTYDGIDVRDIAKDSLRRSLGIVLQDTHLFTGTIADNIRFGKLDATREEIIQAAKIANADSFIRRLPQGYDTRITSDGASLSQGQRQLLAIARAAVADPPVLILDEATSSIDTRTEALIEKGMDRLMEGRTVFVIAHRLSTVRNANAIMVLEHGQIVERGDHADLLAQKGEYYQLYNGMFELS